MRRRDFLSTALTGAAAASLAGCEGPQPRQAAPAGEAPAVHTGAKVQWRIASSFPRSLDTIYGAAEVLAERVSAMSDGNFSIRVFPAGELVPGLQVMDAVQQGTVQCGQTASYYYIGKNPALAFDTCVPFGLNARQQNAWLEEAGGRALIDELFADFNIRTFPSGNTGVQMGGWFKRPIRSLADLKGLKMRIPGLGGQVMSALGVSVQVIAGGEIFPALERGAIDATDWVGPYDDEKLGFHKAAEYYHYPGWWEPGPSLSFFVNTDAWAALPKAYQEIFSAAATQASLTMQARYDAKNPPALKRLIEGGTKVLPFTEDLLIGAKAASEQMLADSAAADPAYKKVHEHWRAFREESFRWFGTAELAYSRFAFGGDR
ncbi:MAG: TRAP transporter substrate-binding protein [Alphaproteobacteria bacterium]|nr:TRAP transporter substrate-binding protein [Alphaproteobacteria bacterium]MCB9792352.1 TRAP transporter substrate-binding protein [Alphaproteobacteria bacterium]